MCHSSSEKYSNTLCQSIQLAQLHNLHQLEATLKGISGLWLSWEGPKERQWKLRAQSESVCWQTPALFHYPGPMCTDSCQLPWPSPDTHMHLHERMTCRVFPLHPCTCAETHRPTEEQAFGSGSVWSMLQDPSALPFFVSFLWSFSLSLFLSLSQSWGYRAPATREMSDLVIVQLAAQAWGPVQQ